MKRVDKWLNQIIQGDCLEVMRDIPDKSVDMILCDLPYGTTACKWDTIIPFEPLWEQYERVIKDNGAIVLTASQPFTSALVMSNPKMFKYSWIWDKVKPSGFQVAKYRPMMRQEDVLVFGKGRINYNPIMTLREKVKTSRVYSSSDSNPLKNNDGKNRTYTHKYPQSILTFSNAVQKGKIHPTQKPVALFEYLIRTYTNEGEIVLDNCAGSFTTAVACDNTNRNWICIEKEEEYCNIGLTRVNDNRKRLGLPLLNSINSTIVV
jgi:site-specific DNA-methyltransferase (adenine-specific)